MTQDPFESPLPYHAMREEVKEHNREAEEEEYQDRTFRKKRIDREADAKLREEEVKLRQAKTIKASSVSMKRVLWLWQNRIPMKELTLIAGRGGIGKSTLLCTLAAWITVGDMRGEFEGTPRHVIYVVNEDSLESTVVPRLVAAGADLNKVHFLTVNNAAGEEDRVSLPFDCDEIVKVATVLGAAAILLDPLSSNLRGDTNSQKDMRPILERIRRMAEEAEAAVVGLAHIRKSFTTNLLDAVMGSAEMTNVCRSIMGVMRDLDVDDGSVVLSQEKSNLGRLDIPSYKYVIKDYTFALDDGTVIETGRIEFMGKTDLRVSEMMHEAISAPPGSAIKEAVDWLFDLLSAELSLTAGEIKKRARGEGIAESTLKRAAKRLNVHIRSEGFPRKTVWSLPPVGPDPAT